MRTVSGRIAKREHDLVEVCILRNFHRVACSDAVHLQEDLGRKDCLRVLRFNHRLDAGGVQAEEYLAQRIAWMKAPISNDGLGRCTNRIGKVPGYVNVRFLVERANRLLRNLETAPARQKDRPEMASRGWSTWATLRRSVTMRASKTGFKLIALLFLPLVIRPQRQHVAALGPGLPAGGQFTHALRVAFRQVLRLAAILG